MNSFLVVFPPDKEIIVSDKDRIKNLCKETSLHIEKDKAGRISSVYYPVKDLTSFPGNESFKTFLQYKQKENRVYLKGGTGYGKLFYHYRDGVLTVTSNPFLITVSGIAPFAINWQTVWDFFSFGFIPQPATFFEGIVQVPPNKLLIFDLNTGRVEVRKEGAGVESSDKNLNKEDFVRIVIQKLKGSIERLSHNRVNIVPHHFPSRLLKRICEEMSVQELPQKVFLPSGEEILENLRKIIECTGEPISDPFLLSEGLYAISYPLSEDVIVLNGAGGEFVTGLWDGWNFIISKGEKSLQRSLFEYFNIFSYEEKNLLLKDILTDLNLSPESSNRLILRYLQDKNNLMMIFGTDEFIPSVLTYPLRVSIALKKERNFYFPFLDPELLILSFLLPLKERKGFLNKKTLTNSFLKTLEISKKDVSGIGDTQFFSVFENAIVEHIENWLSRRLAESSGILNWEYVEQIKEKYIEKKEYHLLRKLTAIVVFDLFFRTVNKWS